MSFLGEWGTPAHLGQDRMWYLSPSGTVQDGVSPSETGQDGVTLPHLGQDRMQWRIQDFPKGGRQLPRGGAPTYYLANFFRKLHENKEILGPRGGGARVPRNPM